MAAETLLLFAATELVLCVSPGPALIAIIMVARAATSSSPRAAHAARPVASRRGSTARPVRR
ncbi:hypothetical protein [Acuticoccus sp.]|uniref:hypothetical protein n=1 Tax=Acuticoccus sp. TaxID=1904378 RepID=UPI003B516233